MKILHITIDQKFIPFIQDTFETVWPGDNRFIVLNNKTNGSWNYVQNRANAKIGNLKYFLFGGLKKDFLWCDLLIVHFLDDWSAYAIKKAPKSLPILWSGWGADYYNFIVKNKDDLLLPKTKNLDHRTKKKTSKKHFSLDLRLVTRGILNYFLLRNVIAESLGRINYFSSPIPEDYELLIGKVSEFKAKYQQINYGSIESLMAETTPFTLGNSILLGNSAAATNNHLESFDIINKTNNLESNVVVPLSYGGSNEYVDVIMSEGKKMFGNNFIPLKDYMAIEKYNEILSKCSTVFMNHRRQQGLGNIVVMMFNGARIYLRKENTIYQFFKKQGAHIESIDGIEITNILSVKLTKEQIDKNKEIINSHWQHDVVLNNIRKLRLLKNKEIKE